MLLAISVRSVQQALTQIARSTPASGFGYVAPARIDGEWGTDTRHALLRYVTLTDLMNDADKRDLSQRLVSTGNPYAPPRAYTVMLPDVLVVEFTRQASAYMRGLPAGADVPPSMHNAERPPVVAPIDPSQPTVIPDTYGPRSSPALSIALGLTAAVVVVGGGYWLMTR